MYRELILGPPGTGKTTELLNIVDSYLKQGTHPTRIAYVSFTRAAADEARGRAMERFDYAKEDFPHFRTLHSMAARIMGTKKDDYLYREQYEEIGNFVGISGLTGTKIDVRVTQLRSNNEGNHLLSLISVAQNRKMSVEEHIRSLPRGQWMQKIGRNGRLLRELAVQLESYKKVHGKFDHTDLIRRVVDDRFPPLDVDVAIIDEAQDLTAIQWDFVDWVFQNAKQVYIAGDDDQAIYEWNGADIKTFLHLEGKRRVLAKSWRLPRRPFMMSDILSKRISERYEKEWTHNGSEGELHRVNGHTPAAILEGGDWMILSRNNQHIPPVAKWLKSKGVPFRGSNWDMIRPEHISAIHALTNVVNGKPITGFHAKQLYDQLAANLHVKYGGKAKMRAADDTDAFSFDELKTQFGLNIDPNAPWWDTLTGIKSDKRDYYRRVRQNGERLSNPRVLLSTIHGVKGQEADNVLLLPDVTRLSASMFNIHEQVRDETHRIFYVGTSRAKKRLFIGSKQGKFAYPLPQKREPA